MKKNEPSPVSASEIDDTVDIETTPTAFRGPLRGARPLAGAEAENVDVIDFSWLPEMRLLQRPFAA